MIFNPDNLIGLISDKKELLKMILEIIERNHQQAEGCQKLRESIVRKDAPNHTPENLAQCLNVSLAVSAKNSKDIMEMAQILLVYTSGSNFSQDVGMMANKFGKGEAALKAMFKAKLEGKY